jgi:drug/metabolite transporter (DMT)-like permease
MSTATRAIAPHMTAGQWGLVAFLSILWGASYLFNGIAVREVPLLSIVLARVGIAAAILVPLVYALGHRLPATYAAWRPFIVISLLNNLIPFMLIVFGQREIASGLAAVLNATTPIFALLIGHFALPGQRLKANKAVGVVLGIVGVAVLVGPEAMFGKQSNLLAMLCVLAGSVFYALGSFWGRRFAGVPPLVTGACQLLCSTVVLSPLVLAIDQPWTWPPLSWSVIGALLGLATISSALATVVYFRLLATAGPNNTLLVTLLIPVSAIALGAVVLGEVLLERHFAGAAVIAAALLVIDGRVLKWGG